MKIENSDTGIYTGAFWKRHLFGLQIKQLLIIALSIIGLGVVYLFQQNITSFFKELGFTGYSLFVAGRTFRFIANDMLMILLIYGIFLKKKYVIFAFYVQLAGIILFLAPYLVIKYYTNYNGPLVSFLHRLIINPLLLILLIPAFYYKEHNELT